jgi:C1A family cysteine protease
MLCTETCALEATSPQPVTVEINDATLRLDSITYLPASGQLKPEVLEKGVATYQATLRDEQNAVTIAALNERNMETGQYWEAGDTGDIIKKSFADLKGMFQGVVPAQLIAALYYKSGYLPVDDVQSDMPVSKQDGPAEIRTDPLRFDWRNRHGKNWLTGTRNQGQCGSCYAFGSVATVESFLNLYYNQLLNKNLSEQEIVSCMSGGGCDGGSSVGALNYVTNAGVVDEQCFPYSSQNGSAPACPATTCPAVPGRLMQQSKWRIAGKQELAYSPTNELDVKTEVQKRGPLMIVLEMWNHAVSLVGFGEITPGCYWNDTLSFGCNQIVPVNDPLIGKTYWLVKNSWGTGWGDGGVGKMLVTNFPSTASLTEITASAPTPPAGESYVTQCDNSDGDAYCWWGVSPTKPASCPASCSGSPEPDCNDADAAVGICTTQDICGTHTPLPSGEVVPFGYYTQFGQAGCCGDWLNEYPVGDLCCNSTTDQTGSVVGYETSGWYGAQGSGTGQFNYPDGVAIDGDVMAVADKNNNRVQIFRLEDDTVTYLNTVGSAGSGDGQFSTPVDVALHDRTLLVADQNNRRVQIFTLQADYSGSFDSAFGTAAEGNLLYPSSVDYQPESGMIAVADRGTHKVQMFRLIEGSTQFIMSLGVPGNGDGQFQSPSDAVFTDDKFIVCDQNNGRIQLFDQSLHYLSQLAVRCNRIAVENNQLIVPHQDFTSQTISTYQIAGMSLVLQATFPDQSSQQGFTGIAGAGSRLYAMRSDLNKLQIFQPAANPWSVCSSVCTDGTPSGQCATAKPSFCNGGTLVNNCESCGCPDGETCQLNGTCARETPGGSPILSKLPAESERQ